MPVAYCSGREPCDRLISISAVPGGNPAAKADPDAYASEWGLCSCGSYTCDRCLQRQQGRCRCGLPARVFSEAERIRVARGGPRPGNGGAHPHVPAHAPPLASPPLAARIVTPPASGVHIPICPMLEGVAQQIEAELVRGNFDKARAMAGLAATIIGTQGQHAPAEDVPWLLRFGESFYRWKHFYEGQQYFTGLYELMKRHRLDVSDDGMSAFASALAFQVLSGDITAASPSAPAVLARVSSTFGYEHVLAREVQARLGAPASNPHSHRGAIPTPPSPRAAPLTTASPRGLAAAPTPASPRAAPPPMPGQGPAKGGRLPRAQTMVLENLTLLPPPVADSVAAYDEPTRLALWVTLAFLDVAFADGRVAEQEYHAWVKTMRAMALPDVWTQFGQQALYDLLQRGVLYDLSSEFAWLPVDQRNRLATALVEFMMADGRAEASELEAVKRIGGWIEVKISFR
ncbi:MAG: TerB family tellurite resistance protein [Polyangiaceae bacterium]|jgi:uncharacterized tellurite resistance protein B-like protein|nr:TerB family tellurite resistance protein [Polyangiaceae bacterium]